MPTFKLDGVEVTCPDGWSVLEAALERGLDIPYLCHHPALRSVGACRVCVVAAEGPRLRPSVIASCTLRATDGLEVRTDTPEVTSTRRTVLELLLSRAPDVPAIRDLAARAGVTECRFPPVQPVNNCVLCGRCVRICEERLGREAITYCGRSGSRTVTAAFERPSATCLGCGSCANVCPTGVIRIEDSGGRRRVINKDVVIGDLPLARCARCGETYGTEELRDWVASRSGEFPRGDDTLCPDCARADRASRIRSPWTRD
jgi:predicted molibdopterin-dependent oxidoreductase YjgC